MKPAFTYPINALKWLMRHNFAVFLIFVSLTLCSVVRAAEAPATWDEMRAGETEMDGEQRMTMARKLAKLAEPQLQMMHNQTAQVLSVAEPYLKNFYAANPGRETEIRSIYARNMHATLTKYFGVFRGLLPKVLANTYSSEELQRFTDYYQEPLVQKKMKVIRQSQDQTADIAQSCFKQNGVPTNSNKIVALGKCGQQQLQPILQQGMGSDYPALQQLEQEKYADVLSEKSLTRATQKLYHLASTPEMALYLLKLMRESQNNLQQDFLAAGITMPQQVPGQSPPATRSNAPTANDPLNPQSFR